jgi:hypothetical protein
MNDANESEFLEHLKSNNYGPDGTHNINWRWSHSVHIEPDQRVVYRFSVAAQFENAVIIYSMPDLKLLAERGNYSRSLVNFEFTNKKPHAVEHLITAWHKASPPRAREPWQHSPSFDHIGTPQVEIVGFADDQRRDDHYPRNPDSFRNALVSIVYY